VSHGRRLRLEQRLLLLVLIAAGPAWLVAALLLMQSDASPAARWAVFVLISAFVAGGAWALAVRVVHPLRSLANLLEGLREGDYSLRGRNADPDDALGEVMIEVNSLSRTLRDQRLAAIEASVLLEKIISEIDIAVFAFDPSGRLRLANRAGEALLGARAAELVGSSAADLGLAQMLRESSGTIVLHAFKGGMGRWEIRRRAFREGGRPHELLVISDLSRALREEERQAWRRLVRVIGHELNGSLAPIKSMAGMLRRLTAREPLPADWREDAQAGLGIIHDRAESLGRFMGAYAQLARLPAPTRHPVEFAPIVRRAASLHGERVTLEGGPEVRLDLDADQIEQVLINLIKNAVEAAGETGGARVRWRTEFGKLLAEIEDDGPGLARTDNLWVPFFTTKPTGSGIGLVLSREIVENHGGLISLQNRADARGCVARISLPLGVC
jgi:two-component system, NtrC family, nitrogen regulation sensor histidine kinase NtrY